MVDFSVPDGNNVNSPSSNQLNTAFVILVYNKF